MKYSNPRKEVTILEWPHGAQKTKALFWVDKNPKTGQERAIRMTVNPKTGQNSKPKVMTYAEKVRFVDGDDGKLYFIELTAYGFISVMRGTFNYLHETIYKDYLQYAEVLALFDEVK